MTEIGGRSVSDKKKSWRWGIALSLVAAIAGAGYVALIPGPASQAIAAAVADPLSVLASRSPGQRARGALNQTKPAKVADTPSLALAGLLPTERVLSNVRTRPPVIGTPDASLFEVPANVGIEPDLLPIDAIYSAGGGAPPVGPIAGPVVAGGVPGGGAGGFGVIDPPGGEPGDTPAVPEPGTWIMMMIGFFGIGAALRSAPRAAHSVAGCA